MPGLDAPLGGADLAVLDLALGQPQALSRVTSDPATQGHFKVYHPLRALTPAHCFPQPFLNQPVRGRVGDE